MLTDQAENLPDELHRNSVTGGRPITAVRQGMQMDSKNADNIFRTIFEHSRDAILLADSKGKILEVNPACINLFGYKTSEALLNDIKLLDDIFEAREAYGFKKLDCKDDSVKEFEARLIGRNSIKFDAAITCNLISDASEKNASRVVLIKDTLKNNGSALHVERRRNIRLSILRAISITISSSLDLTEILNNTIDSMLEISETDSVRIYLLNAEKRGLDLVAHKGLSGLFTSYDHMKYREIGDGLLGQAAVTGEVMLVDNFLRADDPYVDCFIEEGLQTTAYIPLISKGETGGVMAVSSHSEFKFSNYHVELLSAIGNHIGVAVENANLYDDIKSAYQELKTAQEQVVRTEKLASLGKLSATIAHEINNPLAALLTYIKLMMKLIARGKFNADKMKDISRYLNTMESETSRCGEIVKNLLAFSRQSKITIEPQDIEDIIDKTLMLIEHDLDMKEIRFVKKIEPDLPQIQCDFKQIQQTFLNLMSNASEAMSKGGILTVAAARSKKKGFVDVDVSDTGCGILKKDLPEIFEPFFTTKEEGQGVGLGLSVVFGIIARHKGTIKVESKQGKGSIFKMRLPVS